MTTGLCKVFCPAEQYTFSFYAVSLDILTQLTHDIDHCWFHLREVVNQQDSFTIPETLRQVMEQTLPSSVDETLDVFTALTVV